MYNKTKINGYLRIFMNNYINRLKVLRNLESNRLVYSLLEYSVKKSPEAYNDLLYEIYAAGAETCLSATVQSAVLHDINAFSTACAKGGAAARLQLPRSAFSRQSRTLLS